MIYSSEYSSLEDLEKQYHAIGVSVVMDQKMIVNRDKYRNTDEWLDDMIEIMKIYQKICNECHYCS